MQIEDRQYRKLVKDLITNNLINTIMKKVSIINLENACENDTVCEIMERFDVKDVLHLFGGDPNIINIEGERVHFIKLEHETETVVIYVSPLFDIYDTEIERMLNNFYSGNFEVLESSWNNFTDRTIAYRGGKGYCYDICRIL